MVMPSAMDALSGDMKMFESANVALTSLRRWNPKELVAPTISASTDVSGLGSALMTGCEGLGPAASLHAATSRPISGIDRRDGSTKPPRCGRFARGLLN